MKYLLLFLTFSFASTLQICAQNRSDKELDDLIGPVHTVRVERAITKCESGTCIEGRRGRGPFDTYDVKGNSISSSRKRFDPNDPEDRLRRYPFGNTPSFKQKANIAPDGTLKNTYIYSYNNLSRQSERMIRRPDGSVEQRDVYSFDLEGRLAEQTTYDSDLQIFSRTTYTYDEKGNEVEQTNYWREGSSTSVISFEYEFDNTGNWVKKIMTFRKPKEGGFDIEAIVIYYRTITYY
jgi:hypothetical protein